VNRSREKRAERGYHVEIVVRNCPEKVSPLIASIARFIQKGAYRFLIRLEGPRFEDCVDIVLKLTQEFINASFTVIEGEEAGRDRDKRIVVEL